MNRCCLGVLMILFRSGCLHSMGCIVKFVFAIHLQVTSDAEILILFLDCHFVHILFRIKTVLLFLCCHFLFDFIIEYSSLNINLSVLVYVC